MYLSKNLIVLFFLLWISNPLCAHDWITYQIDSLAKIDIPDNPELQIINGERILCCNDSLNIYMIFVIHNFNLYEPISMCYDNYMSGLLNALPKSGVGYFKSKGIIQVQGLEARELNCTIGLNKAKESEYVSRVLLVNGTLYQYTHTFLKTHPELAGNTDKFFNSFVLDNHKKLSQKATQVKNFSFELGKLFGEFLCLLVLTVIIILVIRKIKEIDSKLKSGNT